MTMEERKRLEELQWFLGKGLINSLERNCNLTDILMDKKIKSIKFLQECPVTPEFILSMISYGKKKRVVSLAVKNIMLVIRASLLTMYSEEGEPKMFKDFSIGLLHILCDREIDTQVSHLIGILKKNGIETMGDLLSMEPESYITLPRINTYYFVLLMGVLKDGKEEFKEIEDYLTLHGRC